jgi:Flp pilus assembly pilin Flp
MFNLINGMVIDDTGAVYAEYGLLAVLIAVAAVVAVGLFGESVFALFDSFPVTIFD